MRKLLVLDWCSGSFLDELKIFNDPLKMPNLEHPNLNAH